MTDFSHHRVPSVCITCDDIPWLQDKRIRLEAWFRRHQAFDPDSSLIVHLSDKGLWLRHRSLDMKPFHLDYSQGALGYRHQHASYKREALARALGRHPKALKCLDVTGGYGQDSVLLATLGAHVTLIERNPVLTALISDALIRAAGHLKANVQVLAQRLTIITMDAVDYCASLKEPCFDVVICDPMFPSKQKDALAKLDMQILQKIQSPPSSEEEQALLEACLRAAPRVVVKRPMTAPHLGLIAPHHSLEHKTVRFDVYLKQPSSS